MRELTVRIRFTKACLGNVKDRTRDGFFLLPRSPQGYVTFLASWHKLNLRFAAGILGKHQDEVDKICWDIAVDGAAGGTYRRYFRAVNNKRRYAVHETFNAGQVVGINCVVPQVISDEDFWRLMQIAGQYKGLSPFKPGEYGLFEVVGLIPRRRNLEVDEEVKIRTSE